MGKLTYKQIRVVADAFIKYLEDKDLLYPWPKPELKTIYKDFQTDVTNLSHKASFSDVLYNLTHSFPEKAFVRDGEVIFVKTAYPSALYVILAFINFFCCYFIFITLFLSFLFYKYILIKL